MTPKSVSEQFHEALAEAERRRLQSERDKTYAKCHCDRLATRGHHLCGLHRERSEKS